MISNGCRAVVESCVPGRVRFRLPRDERREDVLGSVESALRKLNGVIDVTANPETGSVLVRHDPEVISDGLLVGYARDVRIISDIAGGIAAADADEWPETSELADSVLLRLKHIDRTVNRLSRGTIDGKMAVVVLLLGSSAVRALFDKKQVPTPWYTLLWYGYSIFLHWNKTTKRQSP